MHGAQKHLFECMPHSPQKCTCSRACAPMRWCRNFVAIENIANCLESYANIMQAVVCHMLSLRNRSPDAARSRNPSKSTLAHDAVATAVSHKHHSIFRIGAGLIHFVDGLHSKLGHGALPSKFCIFAILRAFWQCVACVCVYTHIHDDNCFYYFQQ